MALSKKHYKEIASIISEARIMEYTDAGNSDENSGHIDRLALELARYFERDNPRFDRERFMQACGIDA